jgi:hypothetical protein
MMKTLLFPALLVLSSIPAYAAECAAQSGEVNAHGTTKSALYLALVESGLSSDVKAGENSGARLYHDFIVRSWHGPFALENGGLELQRRIAAKPEWKIANSRLVAFVQEPNGEIAQTLALPLCPTP